MCIHFKSGQFCLHIHDLKMLVKMDHWHTAGNHENQDEIQKKDMVLYCRTVLILLLNLFFNANSCTSNGESE